MSRSGSQPVVAVSSFGYPLFHLPSTSCFNLFFSIYCSLIACTVEIHVLVTRCFVKVLLLLLLFALCVCVLSYAKKSGK